MDKVKIALFLDKATFCLLCVIAFYLPISKAIIEIAAIIAIVLYITSRFLSGQDIPKTSVNLPIFGYLIICAISIFLSNNSQVSVRTFFGKILENFAIFFVIIASLNSVRRIKIFLFILLASSALLGIDGILQYFTQKDFLRNRILQVPPRIQASFVNANDFGSYLATVIPFALIYPFIQKKFDKAKILFAALFLLLFSCLILTVSRGAWYALIAAVMFMGIWVMPLMIFLLVLSLIIFATYHFYSPLIKERFINVVNFIDSGSMDRRAIWLAAGKMFLSRPWIGLGLGTFMFNFRSFVAKDYTYSTPYAHNCYLQMAAEIGIIGLASFLSILIVFFYQGIRTLNTCKRDFNWHILLATLAAVLGFCVQMAVDTNFYSLDLGMLFWLLLGLGVALMCNIRAESIKI